MLYSNCLGVRTLMVLTVPSLVLEDEDCMVWQGRMQQSDTEQALALTIGLPLWLKW